MALHTIIIEFTDNPAEISNQGVGTYKLLPNGNKIIKAYQKENTPKWRQWAFMCAMHELLEFELIDKANISEEQVDAFDKWFLEQRLKGEPGDHKLSPYLKEHRSSEFIERYICERFELDWHEYFENYNTDENRP